MIITITGKPCSGKSTIAKLIVSKYGFKRIGVGDLFKEEAKKRGLSTEEFNVVCMTDPSYDFFIDEQSAKLGKELEGQKIIFDSRMAWHFVPKSFKVFVNVEEEEMINRLMVSDRQGKESYTTYEEAKHTLLNRQKLETERYKKLYNVDLYDLDNFDLVLDSTNKSAEILVEEVMSSYQNFCGK